MKPREISERVSWMGAVDWDRRLFDSLIPLPDGTSYNAYLVQGSEKTALLDTVDPDHQEILLERLSGVERIDYLVIHHVEQDHSGTAPIILEKYPEAEILTTPKARDLLLEHLPISADRIRTVADGETVSLGDRTLHFMHMPWVHWPETMVTWMPEERTLFTCDFLGSHLACSGLYATDRAEVYEAAKRYYAEIMMPFRKFIQKHLARLDELDIGLVCPSHGPLHEEPEWIIKAYKEWTDDRPRNEVVIPFISMHGSTERMVERLIDALAERDVTVRRFDMAASDIGKLAAALVDAATIVIATPTVHAGPHPNIFYATHLANALRPKLRFASIIGSYGWGTRAVDRLKELIPNLKVELIEPVMIKGRPKEADFQALDTLADAIAEKHATLT